MQTDFDISRDRVRIGEREIVLPYVSRESLEWNDRLIILMSEPSVSDADITLDNSGANIIALDEMGELLWVVDPAEGNNNRYKSVQDLKGQLVSLTLNNDAIYNIDNRTGNIIETWEPNQLKYDGKIITVQGDIKHFFEYNDVLFVGWTKEVTRSYWSAYDSEGTRLWCREMSLHKPGEGMNSHPYLFESIEHGKQGESHIRIDPQTGDRVKVLSSPLKNPDEQFQL